MRQQLVRGHLTGRKVQTPPISCYPASDAVRELITGYWVPVWDFRISGPQTQRTLQSPAPLLVFSDSYQRLYGLSSGMSQVQLSNTGWAVGVVLRPAAGRELWESPMSELVDGHIDVGQVPRLASRSAELVSGTSRAMAAQPESSEHHRAAIDLIESVLQSFLPLSGPGRLLNRIVEDVEHGYRELTVATLARRHAMSIRSLQRLTLQGLGLGPKWLLQRRRIHAATEQLKTTGLPLVDIATMVGYADQAHFTHDFKAVTRMTPGEFARFKTT